MREARRQGFLLLLLSVNSGLGPSAFNKNKLRAYYVSTNTTGRALPLALEGIAKKAGGAAPCGAEGMGADEGP